MIGILERAWVRELFHHPDGFAVASVLRGMRFLALLLLAVSSQAQPLVTNEVVWRVMSNATPYGPTAQAAAVVADRGGFAGAWSEVLDGTSHAHGGHLDLTGHLTSAGGSTSGAAGAVSVAPFGDRYLAAWLEPEPTDGRPVLVTAALDSDFHLIASRSLGLTISPLRLRTTASRAWLAAGNLLYELDKDAAPVTIFPDPRPIDDVAAAGDEVGYVTHIRKHIITFFGPPFDTYTVNFTWLFHQSATSEFRFFSNAPPGIGTNGEEFLIVYFDLGHGLRGILRGAQIRNLLLSTRIPQALDDPLTQPQAAWDGKRWLVVWSYGDGLEAAAIERDLTITPFTLTFYGSHPAIAASKEGRFIVTYERIDNGARNLAARFVEFPPFSRERVVR